MCPQTILRGQKKVEKKRESERKKEEHEGREESRVRVDVSGGEKDKGKPWTGRRT